MTAALCSRNISTNSGVAADADRYWMVTDDHHGHAYLFGLLKDGLGTRHLVNTGEGEAGAHKGI